MKFEERSKTLLAVTKSKAKMYEFGIAEDFHIELPQDPQELLIFTIGILGEYCSIGEFGNDTKVDIQTLKYQLISVAQYFDALELTKLASEFSKYLVLLGAATYYLADMPGSSAVLSKKLTNFEEKLTPSRIELALFWVLRGNYHLPFQALPPSYAFEKVLNVTTAISEFHSLTGGAEDISKSTSALKELIYTHGTDRELLLVDILVAVTGKRIANSCVTCLPIYTGLSLNDWKPALLNTRFIREFWPSQRLLGEHEILKGTSAVIQMPTSAGKTKSTELIIRSAFLSGRAKLAIVVAPFRALCREISSTFADVFRDDQINVNELRDVPQVTAEENEFIKFILGDKYKAVHEHTVLVSTPEKLVYLLRHQPELAERIGLVIFDEGHQFDSGARGVTYELLIALLKGTMSPGTQTVLISAVMSNAETIGDWLNGGEGRSVSASHLLPSPRSIAFASWRSQVGRLRYIDLESFERNFFVPRIIEAYPLNLRGREYKERIFPDRSDASSMAGYLGVKLCHQGPVAVFCGTKSSVETICKVIVDAFERGFPFKRPSDSCDADELERIRHLTNLHFKDKTIFTKSIPMGVLPHSASIPSGLRVSVERAMERGKANLVICTSTLAQGVNLPIKYLIISTLTQAGEPISNRDFHNLIGRAGRAGYHTEGSIIFANPEIYDTRNDYEKGWRWARALDLLDPSKTEACLSSLKELIREFHTDSIVIPILDFIKDPQYWRQLILESDDELDPESIIDDMDRKELLIDAIESYLLAFIKENPETANEASFQELATNTLAYHLGDAGERALFLKAFQLISEKVLSLDSSRILYFGRSLLGVNALRHIENWMESNLFELEFSDTAENLLAVCWPLLLQLNTDKLLGAIQPPELLLTISQSWIKGASYYELYAPMETAKAKIQAGTQKRNIAIAHIVSFTDRVLSYDSMLIVGALADIAEGTGKSVDLIARLRSLQTMLKLGLESELEQWLYSRGFLDREVCKLLKNRLVAEGVSPSRFDWNILHTYKEQILDSLGNLPTYFKEVLQ